MNAEKPPGKDRLQPADKPAALDAVELEIIHRRAAYEIEERMRKEGKYQDMMTAAILTKREADDYARKVRADADEEVRAGRARRVDELRTHAQKLTQAGKLHRERLKGYAVEEREVADELSSMAEDRNGQLEKRFFKIAEWLDGIALSIDALSKTVLVGVKYQVAAVPEPVGEAPLDVLSHRAPITAESLLNELRVQ